MSDMMHRDLPEIVAALAARVERLEDCTQTAVRVAELESASKLAPAANADGGSNHAAPAASGAAVGTCNTFCGERECERADPGQCRRGAPPAASGAAGTGWLDEVEREALEAARDYFDNDDHGDSECVFIARVLKQILARSLPPGPEASR